MRVCPRCSAIFKAQVVSCSGDGSTLVERQDDPHVSSPLGRFLLEALIAEGVTGRIYRSQDAAAVRVLYGDFGTQELIVKRLFRDVEAAKDLQHPNVARILDAGSDDGSTWIASELAPGRTLEALIESEPSLNIDRVGSICAQIAAALAEAHDAELLHRNLSPNNVMVAPKGKRDAIKVLDFGLGSMSRSSQAVRFRTRRDYAAPEALKPSKASKAADVYSLGLIASELLQKVGGKSELGSLVASMIDDNPGKRPQTGRDVLSRLDDLGYSPIAFPSHRKPEPALTLSGEPVSEHLKTDLSADGLVLVGPQNLAEATQPTISTDLLETEKGLVVVSPTTSASANASPGSSDANTTFVYKGGIAPEPEPSARDEVDVEASRRKLGFVDEDPRPKKDASKDSGKGRSLLPRGPVVEKVRTPPNGAAKLDPSEATTPGLEVTSSQMIEEVAMIESGDLEPVSEVVPLPPPDPAEPDPIEPEMLLSSAPEAKEEPAELEKQPPTLLSAADMSDSKPVGGVQTLPAEHPARTSSRPRRNDSFRPKGSWPTEDLVLPNKAGAFGFTEDPRRAPTAIIRTRGVFSSELDATGSGILSGRDTQIVRPRWPSDPGPHPEALPIDRANTVVDPAEGPAGVSAEIRLKPRRSLIPLAIVAGILTVAAVAIALPQLDGGKLNQIRQPVLIQAQPDPVEERIEAPVDEVEPPPRSKEPTDVAALDPLPDGEAPARKVAIDEIEQIEKPEAPEPEKKVEPELEAKAPEPEEPVVREVVERDPPVKKARQKKIERKRKKTQRKRSRARAAPKIEQPDKLERGTLIDPFAE